MEFNLRKARKLEQTIQSHVDEMKIAVETDVRALGEDHEREQKVRAARTELLAQKSLRESLIRARFEIRRMIGQLNEQTGLNSLMTRREEVQALLKLKLSDAEACDLVQMKDLAEARKRQLEKGESGYHSGVTVRIPVPSEEDISRFRAEAAELRRELEDLEDQLSQKNIGAKLTLSAEVVALLRSQDLL